MEKWRPTCGRFHAHASLISFYHQLIWDQLLLEAPPLKKHGPQQSSQFAKEMNAWDALMLSSAFQTALENFIICNCQRFYFHLLEGLLKDRMASLCKFPYKGTVAPSKNKKIKKWLQLLLFYGSRDSCAD